MTMKQKLKFFICFISLSGSSLLFNAAPELTTQNNSISDQWEEQNLPWSGGE